MLCFRDGSVILLPSSCFRIYLHLQRRWESTRSQSKILADLYSKSGSQICSQMFAFSLNGLNFLGLFSAFSQSQQFEAFNFFLSFKREDVTVFVRITVSLTDQPTANFLGQRASPVSSVQLYKFQRNSINIPQGKNILD